MLVVDGRVEVDGDLLEAGDSARLDGAAVLSGEGTALAWRC